VSTKAGSSKIRYRTVRYVLRSQCPGVHRTHVAMIAMSTNALLIVDERERVRELLVIIAGYGYYAFKRQLLVLFG
jgi:hypothetical protein